MDTEKCRKLLREKKFTEVLDVLEEELRSLYMEMLDYGEVEYSKEWSLEKLGVEISKIYPSYFNSVISCENVLYSGEYNYNDSIDMILDSYYNISKNYKTRLIKE